MARKSDLNTAFSDVKIHSISIIPKNKPAISIAALWNVINLHESIFRPVITGNIQINDTVNLRSSFQFSGDEMLYISFSKPSLDGSKDYKKYSKTFRIIAITDQKKNENGSGSTYILRFCSDEQYQSTNKKISRVFSSGKYSDYVKAICKSDLNIDLAVLEETTGPARTHNIRDKSPFEAIDYFEQFSVNAIKSPFFFFENLFGYNYISAAKMFDGTSIVPGGLIVSTAKNSEDAADYIPVRYNEILNFNVEKINDILQQSKNITTVGTLDTFDPMTLGFDTTNFDLNQMRENLSNKESEFPHPSTTFENANKHFWVTSKGISSVPWRTSSNTTSRLTAISSISPYEVNNEILRENDSNIENFLLQRQAMINLLEFTVIDSCEVAGNPAYTVGLPVDIKFPAFSKNDANKRNIDPYLSGRYAIAKVRHNLTKSTGLRTFISLVNNTPLNPLY